MRPMRSRPSALLFALAGIACSACYSTWDVGPLEVNKLQSFRAPQQVLLTAKDGDTVPFASDSLAQADPVATEEETQSSPRQQSAPEPVTTPPQELASIRVAPPPGGEARRSGTVNVHIASSGVALEMKARVADTWSVACEDPCDRALPMDREYRVWGHSSLGAFRLEASPPGQHVELSVSRPSKGMSTGGIALIVMGSITLTAGVAVIIGGSWSAGFLGEGVPCSVCTPGDVAAAAGGVLLVGGLILIAASYDRMATRFVPDPVVRAPASRPDTAWLRTPAWRDSVNGSATRSGTVGVPVFSHSF